MTWRRNVLAHGKQQRRARDRQTRHDGWIGRPPVRSGLRTINLMQFGVRAATAMDAGILAAPQRPRICLQQARSEAVIPGAEAHRPWPAQEETLT